MRLSLMNVIATCFRIITRRMTRANRITKTRNTGAITCDLYRGSYRIDATGGGGGKNFLINWTVSKNRYFDYKVLHNRKIQAAVASTYTL